MGFVERLPIKSSYFCRFPALQLLYLSFTRSTSFISDVITKPVMVIRFDHVYITVPCVAHVCFSSFQLYTSCLSVFGFSCFCCSYRSDCLCFSITYCIIFCPSSVCFFSAPRSPLSTFTCFFCCF